MRPGVSSRCFRAAAAAVLLQFFAPVVVRGQVCPAGASISSCGQGTCIQLTNSNVACLCNSGYGPYGTSDNLCVAIEICDNAYTKDKLCFNGGTCKAVQGQLLGYSCDCAAGYAGTNCQRVKTACDENPNACLNGGVCQSVPTGLVCVCPKQYTGTYCETPRDYGVGGAGAALQPFALILYWGLWMVLLATFLWCAIIAAISWWAGRIRKLLNPFAGAATTA